MTPEQASDKLQGKIERPSIKLRKPREKIVYYKLNDVKDIEPTNNYIALRIFVILIITCMFIVFYIHRISQAYMQGYLSGVESVRDK